MKLTKFLKLRKAVERLDPNIIGRKLQVLDEILHKRGMPLDRRNTAVTHEGLFYIDPGSGIATKVIVYTPEFLFEPAAKKSGKPFLRGFDDPDTIAKFSPYHLMRCNTLTEAEAAGGLESYRMTKRVDGTFYYRILQVQRQAENAKPKLFKELERQQLNVCKYCLWKATSIVDEAKEATVESFKPKWFFDVNQLRAWNSLGVLSKDYGFTKNMYPDDWLEICRIRKTQVHYQCEFCYEELSDRRLQQYLHVQPTDYIENTEGYFKLECLCLACLAESSAFESDAIETALQEYQSARARVKGATSPAV